MVHIPTTQRKFYDNSTKADSMGMTASALAPAVREAQRVYAQQQDIKIDTNTTKARLELDNLNNQWRLANQANPDNAEAKLKLQNDMQSILNSYGEGIDPTAKMKWNIAANKIMSAYELANNQWALGQRAENAKLDVAENINANLQIARNAGGALDFTSGLAEYRNSYNQLYNYAAANMGETEARKLLLDYEEDYMTSFITGLAETDPKLALETLKKPEIAASFKKEGAQDVMMKIVNKQIQMRNYEIKMKEYSNEIKLSEKLEDLPILDALKVLEENEPNISKKFFDAQKNVLLSKVGITAETQATTFTSLLLEAGIAKEATGEDGLKKSEAVLTRVVEEYSKGNLTLKDKKNLIKTLTTQQIEDLPQMIEDASTFSWFTPYDYTNANDDFVKSLGGSGIANTAMLEYFRTINSGDKEYTAKDRKALAKTIISKYKGEALNTSDTLKVGTVVDGYRYIGGDVNDKNSWEKE